MELLEKAAKQGHAYAMQWLGNVHDAREDYEQAVLAGPTPLVPLSPPASSFLAWPLVPIQLHLT
jgi:hypothetical protein